MTQVLGRIRNLLGRIRSCLRNNNQDVFKGQDAYFYDDAADTKNQKVNLISYRAIGDNNEMLDESSNNPEYDFDSKPQRLSSYSQDKVNYSESEDGKEYFKPKESPREILSTGYSNEDSDTVNPSEVQKEPSKCIQDIKPSSDEKPLHVMDILEDIRIETPSFPRRTESNPDIVVVEVGKEYEFYIKKKILVGYSGYFHDRLESNREKRCVLKVKEQCVDPKAFESILEVLCFNRWLTCHNLTTDVIRTATYLEVDYLISEIQSLVHNTEDTVVNALAKFSLIEQIRSHLENSTTMENPVKSAKAIVKGEKGNLKPEHFKKFSDFAYIEKQMIRFFYQSVLGKSLDGNLFEQLATRPHVVVENSDNLTLWPFNVFKHNFKQAVFVDSEIYLESMNISCQLCAQFLAHRMEQIALDSDYLVLSKSPIRRILEEDVIGARCEFEVFLAAVKWIVFKFQARKQFSRELFGCVRFGQMSNKEISALYQPPLLEVMIRVPEIHELIDAALSSSEGSSTNQRTLLLKGKPFSLKVRGDSETRQFNSELSTADK